MTTDKPPANSSAPPVTIDALLPADMARKAEEIGIKKANLDFLSTFALAVLAGAFIALGAIYATLAWTTAGTAMPYGVTRILGGVAFSLGLILVVVGGAELFTGNNLIIMAWASRRLSTTKLLRNWVIVYFGNLVGAVATALIVYLGQQFMFANGALGVTALNIGMAKIKLGFVQAIMLGILCNALVCLAVWLCYSARTTTDRILAIIYPITAFVALGFEHCVANMYFIPLGIFLSGDPELAQKSGTAALPDWSGFAHNLLPVTLGNLVGGALMVAGVYWFIYLRAKDA